MSAAPVSKAKQKYVDRLIKCLGDLSAAFATYDRALFYYNGRTILPAVVDVNLSYRKFLDDLPQRGTIDHKIENEVLELSAHWVISKVVLVYAHAGNALAHRYLQITKAHREWFERASEKQSWPFRHILGRQQLVVDRTPDFANEVTQRSIAEFGELVDDLMARIADNEDKDVWCPYSAEFGVLADKCNLLISEIAFLGERVNVLQGICAHRSNMKWAFGSMGVAVFSLFAGFIFDAVDFFRAGCDKEVVRHLEEIEDNTSDLSREVDRLGERLLLFLVSNNRPAPAPADNSKEILLALEGLKAAVASQSTAVSDQIKDSCDELNKSLQAMVKAIEEEPENIPKPADSNESVLLEIRTLQKALEALKISVDASKSEKIIIYNEDNSKRKRGFFNWF